MWRFEMPTLDWIGKSKVVNHHLDVPYHVLERKFSYVNIPARNTPRIWKDGNRKSGGWKLSLRSIGNLDSGYLETCLL